MSQSKQACVRDHVLELMNGLAVGAAIPSERRLASELGISRPTVRAAVEELAREGMLHRRRGDGTYIADSTIEPSLAASSDAFDLSRWRNRQGARVLRFEERSAGARLGRRLRISPLDTVWIVKRLRLIRDETVGLEVLHVPCRLVPELRVEDAAAPAFEETLRERHGVEIASTVQTIEPTVTETEEARILGVRAHSPAFVIERLSKSTNRRIVELVHSIYRGDRCQLVTTLQPVEHNLVRLSQHQGNG